MRRFLILAGLFIVPYLLVYLLPGALYDQRYDRSLELIHSGEKHSDEEELISGTLSLLDLYPYHCESNLQMAKINAGEHGQVNESLQYFSTANTLGCLDEEGAVRYFTLLFEKRSEHDAHAMLQFWTQHSTSVSDRVYLTWIDAWQKVNDPAAAGGVAKAWLEAQPHHEQVMAAILHYLPVYNPEERQSLINQIASDAAELDPDSQQLLSAAQQGASLEPDAADYLLGTIYSQLEIWDMAESCFMQSVEIEPARAEAWVYAAIARKNQGKDAAGLIQKANAYSTDSDLFRSLMGIYWRDTRPDIAYIYWMKLIASQPVKPEWPVEAASSLALMGDIEGAAGYYDKAVAVAPDRYDVLAAYARFCLTYEYDIPTTGLEQTRAMIRLKPENAQGYLLESRMLMAEEDYVTAERMLQQALYRAPHSAEVLYQMGVLYLSLQESSKADLYFRQASMADDSSYALAASRMLERP